jgi:hypothetical protein
MAAWAAGISVFLGEIFVARRGLLFALRSTGMYILMWVETEREARDVLRRVGWKGEA